MIEKGDPVCLASMQRISAAISRVREATVPIVGVTHRNQPDPVGSAVLFEVGNQTFAMTAAHVLDFLESDTELAFLGSPGVVELSGEYFRTPMPLEGRSADRVDLAFIELSREQRNKLGDIRAIQPGDLLMDHVPDRRPILRSKYLMLGYPVTQQPRQIVDGAYVPISLSGILHETRDLALYAMLGVEQATHLILHFNRAEFANADGAVFAPHPRGASGGGIWILDGMMDSAVPAPRPRLVAIAIEYEKKHHCVVGTRIRPLIDQIRVRTPVTSRLPSL